MERKEEEKEEEEISWEILSKWREKKEEELSKGFSANSHFFSQPEAVSIRERGRRRGEEKILLSRSAAAAAVATCATQSEGGDRGKKTTCLGPAPYVTYTDFFACQI